MLTSDYSTVQAAIQGLQRHVTVVIISHRLSTVKHADQIIVLEDGVVVRSSQFRFHHCCYDYVYRCGRFLCIS